MSLEQPSYQNHGKRVVERLDRNTIDTFSSLIDENPGLSKLFEEDDIEYEINPKNGKLVSHGYEYLDSQRMRSYIRGLLPNASTTKNRVFSHSSPEKNLANITHIAEIFFRATAKNTSIFARYFHSATAPLE